MHALSFRRATASDVSLVAALNQLLQVDEAHPRQMELSEIESRTSRWLQFDGYEAILFEDAGETAGYALYRREEDHFYLKQFFVCRQFRRQSVGRRAIDWLMENVWHNAPAVYLDVLTNNSAGIAFWHAVGFRDYCIAMERKLCRPN